MSGINFENLEMAYGKERVRKGLDRLLSDVASDPKVSDATLTLRLAQLPNPVLEEIANWRERHPETWDE